MKQVATVALGVLLVVGALHAGATPVITAAPVTATLAQLQSALPAATDDTTPSTATAAPPRAAPSTEALAADDEEPIVEPTPADLIAAEERAAAATGDPGDVAAPVPTVDPQPGQADIDGADPVASDSTGASSDVPASAVPAAAVAVSQPPAPEGIEGSEQFVGPLVMANFRILGQEVLPGARARLEWTASQSFAGSEVISPVVVVHGVRPGPVLCLTAAVHGDELNGVEIVRRITRRIMPETLSGTVIAVPIVNLFGFSRNSRYLPDRRDLNRFFPGTPGGSIASRIAHSFFTQVVGQCEALVDFHTGSFDRSNLPQVRADLRLPEVLRFARGFGAVPVLHSNGNRGMLRVAATQANIPSVTFEVGAPAILQPVEIEAGVRAIDSLMHYLGMTPVAIDDQEPQAIFYDSVWVRANAGGLLLSAVELGQRVIPGQRLGIVVDPINDVEREILAPLYGRVIGMARNQVVLPGFAAFHVGEETSEERAVREAASGILPAVEEDPDPAPSENGGRDGDPIED
jgi:uncharacterized protein